MHAVVVAEEGGEKAGGKARTERAAGEGACVCVWEVGQCQETIQFKGRCRGGGRRQDQPKVGRALNGLFVFLLRSPGWQVL